MSADEKMHQGQEVDIGYEEGSWLPVERSEVRQWTERFRLFYNTYAVVEGTWLHQLLTWITNLLQKLTDVERFRLELRLRRLRREQGQTNAMQRTYDLCIPEKTLDEGQMIDTQEEDDRRLHAFEQTCASDLESELGNVYVYAHGTFGARDSVELLLEHLMPRAFKMWLHGTRRFKFSTYRFNLPCFPEFPELEFSLWTQLRRELLRIAEGRTCNFAQIFPSLPKRRYGSPVLVVSDYPLPLYDDEAFCRRFTVICANNSWRDCVKTVAELQAPPPKPYWASNVLRPLSASSCREADQRWDITESNGLRICRLQRTVLQNRALVEVHHRPRSTNGTRDSFPAASSNSEESIQMRDLEDSSEEAFNIWNPKRKANCKRKRESSSSREHM